MSQLLRAEQPDLCGASGAGWMTAAVCLLAGLCCCMACGTDAAAAEPGSARNLRQIRQLESRAADLDATRALREARAADDVERLDAGIAGSENFTVLAPVGSSLADRILERAELHRQELAITWLGAELPVGQEFTHIHVEVKPGADSGRILLCGPQRHLPGHHRIWLQTSEQLALDATLKHELAHMMLNARFPAGMPAWVNEGIASMYDDAPPRQRRKSILAEFVARREFPQVAELLDRKQLPAGDESGYAVATSLTELLLERGSRETLLQFTEQAMLQGWPTALRKHYAIRNVAELQREWETSLKQQATLQNADRRGSQPAAERQQ